MLNGNKLRGVLGLAAILVTAWLLTPGIVQAQTACDNAVYPSEMTCTPDGNAVILENDDPDASGVIDLSAVTGGYTLDNNAGATWRTSARGAFSDLGSGTLNNAGTIQFGTRTIISAPGTAFTGTGDSRLEMRVNVPVGAAQPSCSAVTTASCLDLSGGTTAGQTALRVGLFVSPDNLLADPLGVANAGIVLVDVNGGTSAADHFVLDPDSSRYTPDAKYGAVLKTDLLLDYTLLYNPNTQRHVLVTVPQREAVEYVTFIQEGVSIWHTTADMVVGRQADLRAGGERGGWLRIGSGRSEREATPSMTIQGNTFDYANDYDLETNALIVGYDLMGSEDRVLGLHLGLVAARQEFNDSSSRDETRGATMGAYAGWWNESGLTVDATLNMNMLTINHRPQNEFEKSESDMRSYGLRAEAGWRFDVSEALYVQPLVTAAYMRANIEDLNLRNYDLSFEDEESQRAGVGVRFGGDISISNERFSRLNYWLTARAWEEYAEDGNVQYKTDSDPLVIEDDISESFEEVNLGVSLTSPDKDLNVFLSGGVQSGDHTDSTNVTIGARLRW